MSEYTVNVWAKGTPSAPIDVSTDALESVYDALLERSDLLGPAVSADLGEPPTVYLTATVDANSQEAANEHVVGALGDVLTALGLLQGYVSASHYVTA